jgi:hypothetical protein
MGSRVVRAGAALRDDEQRVALRAGYIISPALAGIVGARRE